MKPKYQPGQELYTRWVIPGTGLPTGSRVAIVESYPRRGSETRYRVKHGTTEFYVDETALLRHDPVARLDNPIGTVPMIAGAVGLAALAWWIVFSKPNTEAKQTPPQKPALPPAQACDLDKAKLHVFAMTKGLFAHLAPDETAPLSLTWDSYTFLEPADGKAADGTPTWTPPLMVLGGDGSFWTYDFNTSPPAPTRRDDLRAEYCKLFGAPSTTAALPTPWRI